MEGKVIVPDMYVYTAKKIASKSLFRPHSDKLLYSLGGALE